MKYGRLTAILALSLLLTACGHAKDIPVSDRIETETVNVSSQEIQITEMGTDPDSGSETDSVKTTNEVMGNIFFGAYPQNTEEAEPIEWIVLDSREDRVLLLAKGCIDSLPWHNAHENITWENCDLRAWLNNDFAQTAFTAEEEETILLSDLDNRDDLGYGTPAGENTQDKVFLLSGAEIEEYLPSEKSRTVKPTAYAISHGAYTNGSGDCAWWLRSPGMTETSPAYLSSGGSIGNRAHEVGETIIGVRPAVWVKKEVIG